MKRPCDCLNCITPPYLMQRLLESENIEIRQAAMNTLLTTAKLRGERELMGAIGFAATPAGAGRRTIYDYRGTQTLRNATLVRTEDGPSVGDPSVNRAFDGLGATRDFFKKILGRDSIDDRGMRLDAYVHYGRRYQNAFWNGRNMVFGDGDGQLFADFTLALDVIAHELTHGVTEFSAGLEYANQSGALNESISDVFGSLVKQWDLKQDANTADWLIGEQIFTPNIEADALRSMKAPGTAFDNNDLGKDPQPAHMDDYVKLPNTDHGDYGGVHINSGIPNKAFYLAAVNIGGYAWEAAGHIWYEALRASSPTTQFQDFADTTYFQAGRLYGSGSNQQQSVLDAWGNVGIQIRGVTDTVGAKKQGQHKAKDEQDGLIALTKQVKSISSQVKSLIIEIETLKGKP